MGRPDAHRALPRQPGDPHQPAHALRDLVEARPVAIRAVLPEARYAAIDEPRVERLQGFVVDTEPEFHVRAIVLDHDIHRLDQPVEDRAAVRFLEVERQAALVAMQVLEIRAVAVARHVVALARHLDLDDVGAPISQMPGAGGSGARARQIQHLEAGKRLTGRNTRHADFTPIGREFRCGRRRWRSRGRDALATGGRQSFRLVAGVTPAAPPRWPGLKARRAHYHRIIARD